MKACCFPARERLSELFKASVCTTAEFACAPADSSTRRTPSFLLCERAFFGVRDHCWKAERGSQKLLEGDDWRLSAAAPPRQMVGRWARTVEKHPLPRTRARTCTPVQEKENIPAKPMQEM